MNVRKFIIALYFMLFVGIGVTSAGFFWQTRREFEQLKLQEAQTRARLAELQTRLAEQETTLKRLREDPGYVERVIRRRLLYAKPEEFVFRFPFED
ncbi:MAG: septum formation initiator family protein [Opitutaceae bacterium]|nr:septum formation initiator family protein [Opitutaceae bacterium]